MTMKFRLVVTVAAAVLAVAPISHAAFVQYEAALGPEVVGATGSGFVTVDYDSLARTLAISVDWSGLSAPTTVAHIHCCTATPNTGTVGVAVTPTTLPGFPDGVTMGSYDITLDLSQTATYTPGFLTSGGGTPAGAEAFLFAGMNAGTAYFNIHSTAFPGGEIRGFLAEVPEPATLSLFALALAGLGFSRRRKLH